MAEQFLTLMADLDESSQALMSEWYNRLCKEGFDGQQTHGLPYHISLGSFALDKEAEAADEMQRLADDFKPLPIQINHLGIFSGGKVLFGAPSINSYELIRLRNAIQTEMNDQYPWSPHATILIDEPEIVCKALPVLIQSFTPFSGMITRLHLCAFWPTREIASVTLRG